MAHSSGQYELFYGARRNPDGLARVDYRPLGKQRTQAVSAVRFSTVALIAVSLSASIGTRQDSLVCGICLPATRQRCILKIKSIKHSVVDRKIKNKIGRKESFFKIVFLSASFDWHPMSNLHFKQVIE